MSVGKQGSPVVTITYDDGSGVARSMGSHVLTMGPTKETLMQEPSHGFGDSALESTPTGFSSYDDWTFEGFFDTTATTGPKAVFQPNANDRDPNGTTRTLVIGYGDSVTFTCETRLLSFEIKAEVEKLTRYVVTMKPTGAGVWAP